MPGLLDWAADYGRGVVDRTKEMFTNPQGLLYQIVPSPQEQQARYSRLRGLLQGPETPEEQAYKRKLFDLAVAGMTTTPTLPKGVQRIVDPVSWRSDLGGAAFRDDGKYLATHVTADPSKVLAALKEGRPLADSYGAENALRSELGGGLYVSARPSAWKNRAMGEAAQEIPVEFVGRYAHFDTRPTPEQIKAVRDMGLQGAYMSGGMSSVPQLVIWDNSAIRRFGDWVPPSQ